MKKTGIALCAFAMLATLAGCKDARADISNGSTKLVSVGDTTISKQQIYELLKQSSGSDTTLQLIQTKIYEKEDIKLTDEMKKEASDSLNDMKKSFGNDETFLSAITSYGFKDEQDYLEKASYPAQQSQALLKKYVKENQKTLFEKYHPVKANIIEVEKKEDAEKALKALQNGDKATDVAKSYGKTDTYDGSEKICFQGSGLPDAVFAKLSAASARGVIKEVIEDTTGGTFYVAELTNIDPTSFADKANEALISGVADLSSTMMEFYLKKYNFTIYDIDIYNQIKSSNESYIVQK